MKRSRVLISLVIMVMMLALWVGASQAQTRPAILYAIRNHAYDDPDLVINTAIGKVFDVTTCFDPEGCAGSSNYGGLSFYWGAGVDSPYNVNVSQVCWTNATNVGDYMRSAVLYSSSTNESGSWTERGSASGFGSGSTVCVSGDEVTYAPYWKVVQVSGLAQWRKFADLVITYDQEDLSTATPTATPAPPTATPGTTTSFDILRDGDMEQRPASQYWSLTNPNAKFGRLFDGNIWTGDDACTRGSGYQGIGALMGWPWEWGEWGSIYQTFAWPGGTVYWSVTARGHPDNDTLPARMVMYLVDAEGTQYMLLDQQVTANWTVYTGTHASLASGAYQITIENAGSTYDTIFVDDVALMHSLRPITCSGGGEMPGVGDATVTPTPTPAGWNNGSIDLVNCDFEDGLTGWSSQPSGPFNMAATNHVLDAAPIGPVGPNYVSPDSRQLWLSGFSWMPALAPMWQTFTFVGDGPIYFSIWAYAKPLVKIKAHGLQGGVTTVLLSVDGHFFWTKYLVTYNGPRSQNSQYSLMLFNPRVSNLSDQPVDTRYDGISIGSGGYVDTCSILPTVTPNSTAFHTATPSNTPTASNTPTGTIRPSRTTTRTPIPSLTRTRLPSWTPGPTRTPRSTDTQLPTHTSLPTWTGAPPETYTPYPTGTPWPTYTPYPTGTPPPWGTPAAPQDPGPDANCEMPDDWYNVSAWVDFEMCRLFRWFSWSEANDAQVTAMSEVIAQVEPYGSMLEGYESLLAIKDIWGSYDWINTGYEGKYAVSRPNLESITLPALDGEFSFEPDAAQDALVAEEVAFCKERTTTVFGQRVAEGMCIVWTYYYLTGVVQWIQFGWDLAALLLLVRYFYRVLFTRG